MQTLTLKSSGTVLTYDEGFKGEVVIERQGARVAVPMEALRKIVAESVRYDLIARAQRAKAEDLLRGAA